MASQAAMRSAAARWHSKILRTGGGSGDTFVTEGGGAVDAGEKIGFG
jgi:hypothetical protein